MTDNKTAHMADEYDEKVRATIPNYELFHIEIFDLVKSAYENPEKWLDTGCGTGNLTQKASEVFKDTRFVLVDPSIPMLDIAKEKMKKLSSEKISILEPASSQGIDLPEGSFDVITAVQCHHYSDREGRKAATRNCFRLLKKEGIYITFENITPFSERGIQIGLDRWKRFQMAKGKSPEEAIKHVDRFGKEYFPISITEHLELLRETGFKTVELLYMSYMQAGFYAIKG